MRYIIILHIAEYLVFAERRLFTLVEMRHQCGVIGNIQIAIFIAVVNSPIAAMYLRAFRHIDPQQGFPVQLDNIHREIGRRSELQRVVDGSDKVLFNLRYSILLNPLNDSIILNSRTCCVSVIGGSSVMTSFGVLVLTR